MFALPGSLQHEQIIRTYDEIYKELLRRSQNIIVPSNARDVDKEIKQLCFNSKVRLLTMRVILDIVTSPRNFTHKTIEFFQDDFLKNILNKALLVPDKYFNDKNLVIKNLRGAKVPFASAIDARRAILGTPTIKQIRSNNTKFYDNLNSCVSYFEAALKDWDLSLPGQAQVPLRPDKGLLQKLETKKLALQKIKKYLDETGFESIESSSIERYENNLREIIETLLDIPEDDELARMYIRAKKNTLKSVREAKKLFNLALDEFALIGDNRGRVDRQTLYKHLNKSVPFLEEAQTFWSRR